MLILKLNPQRKILIIFTSHQVFNLRHSNTKTITSIPPETGLTYIYSDRPLVIPRLRFRWRELHNTMYDISLFHSIDYSFLPFSMLCDKTLHASYHNLSSIWFKRRPGEENYACPGSVWRFETCREAAYLAYMNMRFPWSTTAWDNIGS